MHWPNSVKQALPLKSRRHGGTPYQDYIQEKVFEILCLILHLCAIICASGATYAEFIPTFLSVFRDFSLLTNESVCLATDSTSKDYFRYNKSHGTQFSTSSVRVGASRHEGEVKDTNTKSEGFGNYPPAAPVTVLKRNVKGVWTKFKVTAAGEDQMWLTQLEQPYQAPSEDASGAAGALRGSRSFVQRLLRELIASLPLLPSDANNVKKAKTVRPVKKNRHISGSRSLSSPPSRRSFSVQTLTSTGFQHESSLCETRPTKHDSNNKGKGGVEPGWAGGARALRDAHVRLVLRQLRHVERLNRALDRRAC